MPKSGVGFKQKEEVYRENITDFHSFVFVKQLSKLFLQCFTIQNKLETRSTGNAQSIIQFFNTRLLIYNQYFSSV